MGVDHAADAEQERWPDQDPVGFEGGCKNTDIDDEYTRHGPVASEDDHAGEEHGEHAEAILSVINSQFVCFLL